MCVQGARLALLIKVFVIDFSKNMGGGDLILQKMVMFQQVYILKCLKLKTLAFKVTVFMLFFCLYRRGLLHSRKGAVPILCFELKMLN